MKHQSQICKLGSTFSILKHFEMLQNHLVAFQNVLKQVLDRSNAFRLFRNSKTHLRFNPLWPKNKTKQCRSCHPICTFVSEMSPTQAKTRENGVLVYNLHVILQYTNILDCVWCQGIQEPND